MISSNGIEETISFFLRAVRSQNPTVIPAFFMSDRDHAQMNVIRRVYLESVILLCWWHVLHAWQQHFAINHYPELWDLLKRWIRITDLAEFSAAWQKIQGIAPASVTEYLKTYWLGDIKLWSAVYRKERTIFQDCDTNMLVEAWHHILKGSFMQGKRNRRLDHLIYILVDHAMPYFIQRHHRQENGFEGPDLEVKKRIEIEGRAESIPKSSISYGGEDETFYVHSLSDPSVKYRVDLDTYDCDCMDFPSIHFCKHICAVQMHFPEKYKVIPTSALMIHCTDTFEPNPNSSESDSDDDESKPFTTRDPMGEIVNKLASLAITLQTSPPPASLSDALGDLDSHLDDILGKLHAHDKSLLPPKKKIAPNQNTWTETAAVMNIPIKTKRKIHSDPYSGGERSGKKAKPDARSSQPTPPPVAQGAPSHAQGLAQQTRQMIAAPLIHPLAQSPIFAAALPPSLHPASFDLRNTFALKSLKRQQLNELCRHYMVSAGGTNESVIARLRECIPPDSSTGSLPSLAPSSVPM